MKKRTTVINNIIAIVLLLGATLLVAVMCNTRYTSVNFGTAVGLLIAGAILGGFCSTMLHELGHMWAGKRNGFKFVSISIWFFKWTKVGKKTVFSFTLPIDSAGFTEMTPIGTKNLDKRLIKMTEGALWLPIISIIIGIVPLCLTMLPVWVYCLLAMFLPTGIATFCFNVLPMISEGVKNDMALIMGLKQYDDDSKVTVALLSIQAELLGGKTPAEVNREYYFDLPQLPEDSINFALLLLQRYNYYLDKEDFENAKKVTDRLLGLEEYFPKTIMNTVKANALYNACTFDYDENKADDYAYELEKYLNNKNDLTNIRIKMAYILYVKKEKESIEAFYRKGIKESKKYILLGYGKFEEKLLDKIKNDVEKIALN